MRYCLVRMDNERRDIIPAHKGAPGDETFGSEMEAHEAAIRQLEAFQKTVKTALAHHRREWRRWEMGRGRPMV